MAKQVEDIVVRLVGEGFEALDKIKGSFRELGKVTNLAERDILAARDSLLDFAKKAGNTEAVNKGLGDAFKGLRSQVDLCSDAYRVLSADLRQIDEVSRGATQSIMAQRQAVLASTAAGTQNVAALQQQRAALIALRAQTRDASTAFDQFSADIQVVETRLTDLANVNSRLNSALSRARAGTAAGARAELEVIERGISLRRQEINDIDLLNKKQRNTPEILRQRLELENQLNASLAARRQIQFQETARTGRESVRTGAATFNSADFTGTGYLTAGRISGRLGDLPDTTAGLSQELGELNERLINTYRNTETYIAVQLRLAAVQREVTSATQGYAAALLADLNAGTLIPSQKNLAEVIGQLRREMLELDQTTTEGSRAYAQNATQVRQLEQQLNQLANAYSNVADKARTAAAQGTNPFTASGARNPAYAQQQLAALEAALSTADASSLDAVDALLNAKRSLYEYEAQVSTQLDQQKDQLAAQELARIDAQDRKEAAAFQRELNRLDILKQQTAAAREALGFNTQQQLSPLYQQITGMATAGVARQQQFMGRSPSQVLNDIASSFNAGGRGVDLKQRSTEIGGSVAEGVAQGATDSAATATGAKSFADKLITAYKQAFRIKSPSGESKDKVGVPIGQGIALGIIEGIKSLRAQVQLAIKDVTATPGRAGLPAGVGPVSDVADRLQSFLARSSAKTSTFLPLTRLMGEGVTGSAALPLAAYRRGYERGGIVSPSFLPVEERRGLRGTPGIPGAGLEEIIRAEAFRAVSRTGAFVGPLSGPQTAGGAVSSAYRAGISPGTFQRPSTSGASLPLFGAAAQPAPLQGTMSGMAYRMGGSQFAFPTEGQLGGGRTQSFGRGAANASVTEAISTYRKAVDNFWNGETGSFETIRRVVSSGAQLSASKLARNLSETRNTTAALTTAAVQLVSVPGAAFTKLRAGVGQELAEIKTALGQVVQKDLNSVRSGGQKLRQSVAGIGGTVRNALSPLLTGGGQPRVYGPALPPVPPIPPVPPGGGGGPSPAANNEFTKLNATLTKFGALNRRSVTDIRQLGGALDALKADLSPLDAEYRQVNKSIEAQQTLIERELGRRERRQRRAPSTGQLVQAGGAAISGGIFGGPEGFLGGVGGAVLGTALPGIGTAGGAFAGAAAGAQVGMFRQQLAGTADYAASIGKLQIALRGVVGSQEAYDAAIRAAAAATRDLNIPQEEATRGLTRLSAAVIGAGGTVADSSFAFRAMSEAIKATGGNAEQVDGALLALTQVFSKGKVSAEELNQIAERLPGTFTLFAQAAGKTGPELQKALEQGEVGLNDLMKFLALTGDRYGKIALDISSSSQDAGARLTVAFQAMRLEVGKALQPLGAELQGAFAAFIRDVTPAVVGSAKAIAAALSFFTTNEVVGGLTRFALQMGAVVLALKGLQAAASGLTALNIASWFTAAATGVKITGDYAAAATPKVAGFRGALVGLSGVLKSLAAIGVITVTVDILIKNFTQLMAAKAELDRLKKARSPVGDTGPTPIMTAERRFAGASRETVTAAINTQKDIAARLRKELTPLEKVSKSFFVPSLFAQLTRTQIDLKKQQIKNAEEIANLTPSAFKSQAQIEKERAAAATNFPGTSKEEKDNLGASLLQAIEQREEALLNLRTQREEQIAQIRKQAVEQAKQAEERFAQQRLTKEREIAQARRELAGVQQDIGFELGAVRAAATGGDTEGIRIQQRITEAARQRDEERIRLEQSLLDEQTERNKAVEELKTSNASAINEANLRYTKAIGDTQRDYARASAKIIEEGTGRAGNRLAAAGRIVAALLQQSSAISVYQNAAQRGLSVDGTNAFRIGGSSTLNKEKFTETSQSLENLGFAGTKAAAQTVIEATEALQSAQRALSDIPGATAVAGPAIAGITVNIDDLLQGVNKAVTGLDKLGNQTAETFKTLAEAKFGQAFTRESVQALQGILGLSQNLRSEQAKILSVLRLREDGMQGELAERMYDIGDTFERARDGLDAAFKRASALTTDPQKLLELKAIYDSLTTSLFAAGSAAVDFARAMATVPPDIQIRTAIQDVGDELTKLMDPAKQAISAASAIGDAFGNSFKGIVTGSMTAQEALAGFFSSVADYFADMAAKMIVEWIKLAFLNTVLKLFPGANAGLSDLSAPATINNPLGVLSNANGNAYAKNNIVPYAMGGAFTNSVVSKPTLFKFAQGGTMRTGLMGEAGPEAIMPLSRGANGKLGVASTGGGAPVSVTVNVDASGNSQVAGDQNQGAQLGRVIAGAVQQELIRQRRPGGLLA